MTVGTVLLFSNLYPTPAEPERGIFIRQLAQALARHCKLIVVCPLPWLPRQSRFRRWFSAGYADIDLPTHRRDGAIDVYYLRYPLVPKISDYIQGWLIAIFCWRRLSAICTRHRVTLISGQWIYPDGFAAALYASQRRIPLVLTALGSDINRDLERPLIAPQIRFALAHSDFVAAVSEPLRAKMERSGVPTHKLKYIPTGVDQEKFHIQDRAWCRAGLGLAERDKIVVVIGRLVAVKGHDILLRALEILRREWPLRVVCYIVGDGPLRATLAAQAQALGLTDSVVFVGARAHDELPQWLGAADVLCLPSRNEGQPNVVLESLAAGRPVVAAAVGGVPQLVNANNGSLFPAEDASALSAALAQVLSRTWDPLAVRATVAQHTFSAQANSYRDIFRAILGRAAAATLAASE